MGDNNWETSRRQVGDKRETSGTSGDKWERSGSGRNVGVEAKWGISGRQALKSGRQVGHNRQ